MQEEKNVTANMGPAMPVAVGWRGSMEKGSYFYIEKKNDMATTVPHNANFTERIGLPTLYSRMGKTTLHPRPRATRPIPAALLQESL